MDSVHTETRHGLTIKIYHDENDSSPDDNGDDGAFLVFYHRGFTVTRDKIITKEQLQDYFQGEESPEVAKLYYILPLSALIHSGVHLYLGKEDHPCDSGGWDSSFAGAVLLSKKEFKTKDRAKSYATGLINEWNDCLAGNVYGYVIEDAEGNKLDSCWRYIGDYESGALLEARSMVDMLTANGKKEHTGQLLLNLKVK
jgi:hypothetical protein